MDFDKYWKIKIKKNWNHFSEKDQKITLKGVLLVGQFE